MLKKNKLRKHALFDAIQENWAFVSMPPFESNSPHAQQ